MINKYKDKKVLIFGLGLNQGGVGSAKFFASHGAKVRITDLKSAEILKSSINELKQFPEIEYMLGEHRNEDIDWADLIIKNPAVKPNNQYIQYALKIGKLVETDMGIFLNYVNHQQIIGITGTKGKSTTASLIYEVLRKTNKNVLMAGNIGKSVLDIIDSINSESLVVLEISSFQLEAFDLHKVSPKRAVITNITPDHLNYYSSMEDYINAKKVIAKYQTKDDYLFLRKNDPITTSPDFIKDFISEINYFSEDDLPENFHPILEGRHNLQNMSAALALSTSFNLNRQQTLDILSQFKGVAFRLEKILNNNGITIFNDSAATSPEAGIYALETYPNSILICGGMNKKMDYKKYTEVLAKNVKKVFLLEGDSTDAILSFLNTKIPAYGPYDNLEELLLEVKRQVKPGDIILFSPAATSFNLFQNEFDRGRKFNEAVKKIFKAK